MKVGRFQVMATLQAARAEELGMSASQAKSWGLNRAIFYAAAKRGFKKAKVAPRGREEVERKPLERKRNAYFLGTEMAYCSKKGPRTYFTIGGELQTEDDFNRQITVRFGKAFPKAWKESLTSFVITLRRLCSPKTVSSPRSTDPVEMNWLPNGPR